MFQRGRSIRDEYEDRFMGSGNSREVTFHRTVNVVERRSLMQMMGGDFDRRGHDVPMYNDSMPFQNPRDCQGSRSFPPNDMQYFDVDDHRGGHFHRNPPPQRNDFMHNRDDLRHHLESRNINRGGNYFRNRGRDSGRDDTDYRRRESFPSRERSPIRRGSHSSSSSSSRTSEKKTSSQQKSKPTAPASPPPPKSPTEEPPPTTTTTTVTTTSKESPPASVAEEEEEAVAEAASVEPEPEPKPIPELDLKARRVEAIKAKALEIEKDYRQDCETFRTVVKMLVEKEPSLDYLLQAPLEKNLEEMKGRCLDSLKQFIKELDEAIEPSTTDQPTEEET